MSAKILAIESALSRCSVALLIDGMPVIQIENEKERVHAEQLAPMIASALSEAHLEAKELTAVAVSAGPGSYTGLRIGVSTAKGICYATEAGLIGVSTLEALALQAAVECDVSGESILAVAMRARAKELYWAIFRTERSTPTQSLNLSNRYSQISVLPLEPVQVTNETEVVTALLDHAGGQPIFLIGNAAPELFKKIGESTLQHGPPAPATTEISVVETMTAPLALSIAELGYRRFKAGFLENVSDFEPAYLKEFIAAKRKGSIFDQLQF